MEPPKTKNVFFDTSTGFQCSFCVQCTVIVVGTVKGGEILMPPPHQEILFLMCYEVSHETNFVWDFFRCTSQLKQNKIT